MADRYYGPGADGAAETITGATRSKVANVGGKAGIVVELSTPAGFDRNVNFQVSVDPPHASSPQWVDAKYLDLSDASAAPAIGSFAPGASIRKIYQILASGRSFSVNVSGGAAGNASWRILATESPGTGQAAGGSPSGASANEVQGTAATNTAAVGKPVQTGGVYNSTLPTLDSGDVGPHQLDANGRLINTLGTALAGEDFTNGRHMSEVKPANEDAVLETLHSAAAALGNGTAINVKGHKSLTLHLTGTFTATVTFEATIDDTNWFTVGLYDVATGSIVTAPTAAGAYSAPHHNGSWSQFRARISAYTSGSVTVKTRKHPR